MGDGVSDGGNGDEPLFLAAPEGSNYAVSFDDAMDEEVEILERKQKFFLAKSSVFLEQQSTLPTS